MLNTLLADPNIVYTLMILGIWGIFFEVAHPGYLLPGIIGVAAILLTVYAFQSLPINYIGVGLILFSIALMLAEAFLPTHGALGVIGVIAFIIGSMRLLQSNAGGNAVALPLIFSLGALSALFFLIVINLAIKARFRPVVSGREELIGKIATLSAVDKESAWVHIHSELWQVRASAPLQVGQQVQIIGVEGNILLVETIKKFDPAKIKEKI